MRAGKLRHKIDIEEQVTTQDDYGQATTTWSAILEDISAEILPLRGKEFFSGEKFNGEITHKIRIRYRSGINSKHRVKFGSRYFYLKTPPINWEERNIFLEFMCEESDV
jgi:SPP1 family predicted phage head-tail adaptor